eukprot:CAMPEP_0117733802 /NCGR_PEP_ID=MMETSP0947-20121206/283_1 /TAXON_ID=44440 /ORGANISM="Chattonella subsalsa, Strain CCMP2191" /LENGTH=254 /DNA_ID=CAMNT_0005548435 /DNA_START=369 /DNA_END=1133 /DNA_ORIENTATION=-
MEDITTFLAPEESPTEAEVEGDTEPTGAEALPLNNILGQILGIPNPSYRPPETAIGVNNTPGTVVFQTLRGGQQGMGGTNLVIMGTNGLRATTGSGVPGGTEPGGMSGLFNLLGGMGMQGTGGAQTIGDYAFGNISTIIEQLVANSPDQRGPPPTAQRVIENLAVICIDKERVDAHSECAVCKDAFELGDQSKQLPCTHMFHENCIVPWLKQTNSCPICRFELPTDDPDYEQYRASRQHRQQQQQQSPASTTGN